MIEFDHVTRTYGAKTAVSDLTLAIPRGELFALLGASTTNCLTDHVIDVAAFVELFVFFSNL